MKMTLLMTFICLTQSLHAQVKQPADYVNPFIGASTNIVLSGDASGLGKTFPGATTPFGMAQLSPNTITGGDNGSGYSYEHTSIEGFALTQMSGVGWYGDMGNFLVTPATGKLKTNAGIEGKTDGYRTPYNKSSEKATAGYYSVILGKQPIKAELTASPHGGIMRFTFPKADISRIQIDLARRVGGTSTEQYIKVAGPNAIEGWIKCTPDGGGWGDGAGKANYTVYFYATFSKSLETYGVWSANIPDTWTRRLNDVTSTVYQDSVAHASVLKNIREKQGKHIGFFTEFATAPNEIVELKTAISFVSIAGAKGNYEAELRNKSFSQVHAQAKQLWNNALSKIKIEGSNESNKTIFYTALYHTMIDPRTAQDVDGKFMGGDQQVHQSKKYIRRTIFSGWDVFRSQLPLLSLIAPRVNNDQINSLIDLASETGNKYFSRWELLNAYSECMIGTPALSIITDAYAKNIRNYNIQTAFNYSVNTAMLFNNNEKGFSGPPYSISNTLEYAYTNWCLSQLAHWLNKKDIQSRYASKALDYKNSFDTAHHWFRPRKDDGNWEPWPQDGRLTEWYGSVESNPYQQGWFVPHDIAGMIQLIGNKEIVRKELESFFTHTPSTFRWNKYYNHANEPVHHVPFLFNHVNTPWLTQKWTRTICNNAYQNSVEGLVGNDDCGQMSAWYALAACGLYQICPGNLRFEITSPLFNKIKIKTDNKFARGNTFTLKAKNNSSRNIYIQKALLNGKSYNKCYIDYADIINGATLELIMGPAPNKKWGIEL